MPPSGANANSDGGCSIDQTSSQKPRQGFRRFPYTILSVRSSE